MKKKRFRTLLSLMVTLSMLLPLFPTQTVSAGAENASSVSYLDADGETQECTDYTVIDAENIPEALSAGWYVVNGDVSVNGSLPVTGSIHLILTDGCSFKITGSLKGSAHSITIYAQTAGGGSTVGCMEVTATDHYSEGEGYITHYSAAIQCMDLTINGGHIVACGESYTCSAETEFATSMGIQANGAVTINDGLVEATGGETDFASYGFYQGGLDPLTVNGGTFKAKGMPVQTDSEMFYGSIGIINFSTINIKGGSVTATSSDVSVPVYVSESAISASIQAEIFCMDGGTLELVRGSIKDYYTETVFRPGVPLYKGLYSTAQGSYIAGGTVNVLTDESGVELRGGTFGKLTATNASNLASMLKSGYRYRTGTEEDYTYQDGSSVTTLSNVTVVPPCPHTTLSANGTCTECGTLVAEARIGETYYRYFCSADGNSACHAAQAGDIVIVLKDIASADTVPADKNYSVNYNGHTISCNPLVVGADGQNGVVAFSDTAATKGAITSLSVTASGTTPRAKLASGNYNRISVPDGVSLSSLLDTDCQFKDPYDGKYISDPQGNSLTYVTVAMRCTHNSFTSRVNPICAYCDQTIVASVNDVEFFIDFATAAQSAGGTAANVLKLYSDITLSSSNCENGVDFSIDNCTLDLNGHTISAATASNGVDSIRLYVENGLTVIDSSGNENGRIAATVIFLINGHNTDAFALRGGSFDELRLGFSTPGVTISAEQLFGGASLLTADFCRDPSNPEYREPFPETVSENDAPIFSMLRVYCDHAISPDNNRCTVCGRQWVATVTKTATDGKTTTDRYTDMAIAVDALENDFSDEATVLTLLNMGSNTWSYTLPAGTESLHLKRGGYTIDLAGNTPSLASDMTTTPSIILDERAYVTIRSTSESGANGTLSIPVEVKSRGFLFLTNINASDITSSGYINSRPETHITSLKILDGSADMNGVIEQVQAYCYIGYLIDSSTADIVHRATGTELTQEEYDQTSGSDLLIKCYCTNCSRTTGLCNYCGKKAPLFVRSTGTYDKYLGSIDVAMSYVHTLIEDGYDDAEIVLLDDVTVTDASLWKFDCESEMPFVIDLNGHDLGNQSGSPLSVTGAASLTVKDSTAKTTPVGVFTSEVSVGTESTSASGEGDEGSNASSSNAKATFILDKGVTLVGNVIAKSADVSLSVNAGAYLKGAFYPQGDVSIGGTLDALNLGANVTSTNFLSSMIIYYAYQNNHVDANGKCISPLKEDEVFCVIDAYGNVLAIYPPNCPGLTFSPSANRHISIIKHTTHDYKNGDSIGYCACGAQCPHDHCTNMGDCLDCEQIDVVHVFIGAKGYSDFFSAYDAAQDGDTLRFCDTINRTTRLSETFVISKNITLYNPMFSQYPGSEPELQIAGNVIVHGSSSVGTSINCPVTVTETGSLTVLSDAYFGSDVTVNGSLSVIGTNCTFWESVINNSENAVFLSGGEFRSGTVRGRFELAPHYILVYSSTDECVLSDQTVGQLDITISSKTLTVIPHDTCSDSCYCGNTCAHENISDETGVCADCKKQVYVAKRGTSFYRTLTNALGNHRGFDDPIVLLCDIYEEINETLGQTTSGAVIDMNEKTIHSKISVPTNRYNAAFQFQNGGALDLLENNGGNLILGSDSTDPTTFKNVTLLGGNTVIEGGNYPNGIAVGDSGEEDRILRLMINSFGNATQALRIKQDLSNTTADNIYIVDATTKKTVTIDDDVLADYIVKAKGNFSIGEGGAWLFEPFNPRTNMVLDGEILEPTYSSTYDLSPYKGKRIELYPNHLSIDTTYVKYDTASQAQKLNVQGAQIRVTTHDDADASIDLRFVARLGRDLFNFLLQPSSTSDTTIGYGFVVLPKNMLGSNTLTKQTPSAAVVPAVKLYSNDSNEDYVEFTVCLTDIGKSNFETIYAVRPYVTYLDPDSVQRTVYGTMYDTASLYSVAWEVDTGDPIFPLIRDNILNQIIPN